jgi:hypothetical protein
MRFNHPKNGGSSGNWGTTIKPHGWLKKKLDTKKVRKRNMFSDSNGAPKPYLERHINSQNHGFQFEFNT